MKLTSIVFGSFVLIAICDLTVFGFKIKRSGASTKTSDDESELKRSENKDMIRDGRSLEKNLFNEVMESDDYADLRKRVGEALLSNKRSSTGSNSKHLQKRINEFASQLMKSDKYTDLRKKMGEAFFDNEKASTEKRSGNARSYSKQSEKRKVEDFASKFIDSDKYADLRKKMGEALVNYDEAPTEKRHEDPDHEDIEKRNGLTETSDDESEVKRSENKDMDREARAPSKSDKSSDLRKRMKETLPGDDGASIEKRAENTESNPAQSLKRSLKEFETKDLNSEEYANLRKRMKEALSRYDRASPEKRAKSGEHANWRKRLVEALANMDSDEE